MELLKITTNIHEDKMVEFGQAVDYIMHSNKIGHGCLSRGIYREFHGDNILLYMEEWKTSEQLKNHISSDLFKSLLGAMKVLGDVTTAEIVSSRSVQNLEKYLEQI
jgi:quinol monooxygenase YgiN